MWIAIWILLILAFIIIPAALLIWAIKQAFLAASMVSNALSRIGAELPVPPKIVPESFYPGAAMSTCQRAHVTILRRKLKQARARAIVLCANQALLRWQKIGFLSSDSGNSLEVQFINRGKLGEQR